MGLIIYDPSDSFSNVARVMLECPRYSVEEDGDNLLIDTNWQKSII